MHAAPLRDGLTAVQRAFREASETPDAPGDGPGGRWRVAWSHLHSL